MSNLTLQTIIWVLAFGLQITSIARSETVCKRPDFDENLISIDKNQSSFNLYDVIELSCLDLGGNMTEASLAFTCEPSTSWRVPGASECDPSSCASLLGCLGPCSLSSVDDDVGFDGATVEVKGDILVRDGEVVMFSCNGVLVGNGVLACSDTAWSGIFPTCNAECSLEDLVGYQGTNDETKQHDETFTYQCGTESIEVTCDDGAWMGVTECTLNTLPRVTTEVSTTDVTTTEVSTTDVTTTEMSTTDVTTTEMSTTDVTTTEVSTTDVTTTEVSTTDVTTRVMSTETTTVEAPTTTGTTEIPTPSTTVVSTTGLPTIFLSTSVPTELSTTTKPTEVLTTTTEVPTTSTISEVLTTTEAADVLTTTTAETPTTTTTTEIPTTSTTEVPTTELPTRMGSTTSVVTPNSTITTAGNSTITTAGNSTITTAVSTTDSACSYCNFTIEYCGEDDTCVCRPGFFRQSDECIRSRTFYTTMAISQYNGSNASLSMINDADEEVLIEQIISLVNLIFSEQSDYIGCVVFRLTSGSIVADIVTYFNTSTSLNETEINDVITDGFETTQNESTIVIVPERTITQAAFDECELNLDDCHELAECTDTAEYFMCTCLEHTMDQFQGGLDGRLCVPPPTVPEMDMSTSESPMSTADTMPVDRSLLIILIVLITMVVVFLFLACFLAWINNRSIGSKSGFDLKPSGSQASIKILGINDRKESPADGKPFKMEIKEDDGLLNSTTVEAAQALGESIDNPAYVSAGPDVEAPHEMDSFSTPGRTSNPQDMSMTDPTYAEPDAIDDKTKNKMPADGGDPSVESPNREGNDTATSEVDVIYAQPVPKNQRPPSQKDTSKGCATVNKANLLKKDEEEPKGDRISVGLGDLASTMATFPSIGARRISELFEEEATDL